MVDIGIYVSSHLKEELAWAVDKLLRVILTIMLLKNSKSTNKAILNLKQYCIRCYVALSNVF